MTTSVDWQLQPVNREICRSALVGTLVANHGWFLSTVGAVNCFDGVVFVCLVSVGGVGWGWGTLLWCRNVGNFVCGLMF